MIKKLENKRIAFLVENGFEEEELTRPLRTLKENGARTDIVSPCTEDLKAWDHTDWGGTYKVDVSVDDADADDYDMLILPGGVINPDKLRRNVKVVELAGNFLAKNKPVAAICHGAQTLIETGMLRGKTMTSFSSIKTDLQNAGADWVDREVVTDGNLITSRNPQDIPAFNHKIIELLSEPE